MSSTKLLMLWVAAKATLALLDAVDTGLAAHQALLVYASFDFLDCHNLPIYVAGFMPN